MKNLARATIALLLLAAIPACVTPGAGQDADQPKHQNVVTVSFGPGSVTITTSDRASTAPAATQTAEASSKVDATVPVATPVTTE